MWSKQVALITQQTQMGNPNCPQVLEETMVWSGGRDFRASREEVAQAQEAPLYNKLSEIERKYALFTSGSCCVV